MPRRLVAAALLWSWCALAWAAEELAAPQRLIRETADALLAVVSAERAALRAAPARLQQVVRRHLLPRVDFARLSALAVGRAWRTATPDQRTRFIAEFERLLVRTYATGLLELETLEIRYPPQRVAPDADDVLVRTEVLRPGALPVPVDYRLYREGGRWRVYDVVIEGISFASTYRTSFEQEVRQAGLDGLIDRLGELNARRAGAPPPPG
jgi:phospholipid transport system substrate-binding protein